MMLLESESRLRRRNLRSEPEGADPNKVVSGVELATGRVVEKLLLISKEDRRSPDWRLLPLLQVNTISMGSTEPPW